MKRPVCSFLIALILFTACQNAASGDTLRLPESLKIIGDQAFYGVRALREAAVPYRTVSIGELAFAYSGLERITIPITVKEIADNAFEGISGLTVVSSFDSCARPYALRHAGITWENIAPTPDEALNRENIIRMLDAIDPDGEFIIQNSFDEALMFWFGGSETVGEGIERLSTAVHEQCHFFSDKYGWGKEWIYTGDGQHVEVEVTDVFPSSEMTDSIPDSLKTRRFDIYLNGDPSQISVQLGVYGLLDEFAAYCWGCGNEIRQKDYRRENRLTIWHTNQFLAYAEFRYYILHYMLYARANHPDIYQAIMANASFREAFAAIDSRFAGYAEKLKNSSYIGSWNVLMEELAKPDYQNMAALLTR